MDKNDPDFQKFWKEIAPPEQRNWRNFYGAWKSWGRWKVAQSQRWNMVNCDSMSGSNQ